MPLLFLVAACQSGESPEADAVSAKQKLSRFGQYEGYSVDRFDEWVTHSIYIETRDGTRLAADISRPSVSGSVVDEKFPVLWTYSRYHRRWENQPNIDGDPVLQRLLRHGYVIVSVNVRGGGASFGRYQGLFSEVETRDAYDVIDWLSRQPFSDGNIGMYGSSYLGITQYMAASTQHPALKAIVPENGYFNFYDALRRGGILREDMVKTWADGTRYLDKEKPPVPVDGDFDGMLATSAVAEHANNFDPIAPMGSARFRDSTAPEFDWFTDMPSAVMNDINNSGVAIYHLGAWHDAYTLDTLLLHANFKGAEKLAMGPWAHVTSNHAEQQEMVEIWGAEQHRWFDYWLKGIDNRVMDEPKIHVAVIDTPREQWTWTPLDAIPGKDAHDHYYLSVAADSADPRLPKDQKLATRVPENETALDYAVNAETTTGAATRWDSNFSLQADYPDMTGNDSRSLTFSSPPLESDIVVVGVPVMTLFMSSTSPDADIYVVLEEVDAAGKSHYVSEGMLRASLRATFTAPWDNLELPWHRAFEEDVNLLSPGEVVKLEFPIQPIAHRFNRGHRIRLAIMGADKDNTELPEYQDTAISVRLGGSRASRIALPIWANE